MCFNLRNDKIKPTMVVKDHMAATLYNVFLQVMALPSVNSFSSLGIRLTPKSWVSE
jgi:hypothetical protein